MKIPCSEHVENKGRTRGEHVENTKLFFFCFDIQNNFGTQDVLQMLRASEKDLPVLKELFYMKIREKAPEQNRIVQVKAIKFA